MTRFEHDIGPLVLRGLRHGAGGDAGLVVALHGGGFDADYWHLSPRASLLEAGAALGFDVIALDRPGYRGSATGDPDGLPVAEQGRLVLDLIDRLADGRDTFLIGHSLGAILTLAMAGDVRGRGLRAIDVSGVPLRYVPEVRTGVAAMIDGARARVAGAPRGDDRAGERGRAAFFGPDGSFDPALVRGSGGHPVLLRELIDAHDAPDTLPAIMARIAVPVQWTIAEHERTSIGGPAMLDEIRALLPHSPHVRTAIQPRSGHNISQHHVARAYHLRALAFFEEAKGPA